MGSYETEPGIDPARIVTFRTMRKRWKFGEQPTEDGGSSLDFFTDTTRDVRRR